MRASTASTTSCCAALNDLDDEAVAALARDDEPELDRYLDEMWELVQRPGTQLADDELVTSDVVIPPSDLTLEETRDADGERRGAHPRHPEA